MLVRHPTEPFARRQANAWPLPETDWTKLYLNPSICSLDLETPAAEAARLTFNAQSDGLTFLSKPFERERKIVGPSALKLFVSSSSDDADLFVILRVFSRDLKEVTFAGANDPHTPTRMAGFGLRCASSITIDRFRIGPITRLSKDSGLFPAMSMSSI